MRINLPPQSSVTRLSDAKSKRRTFCSVKKTEEQSTERTISEISVASTNRKSDHSAGDSQSRPNSSRGEHGAVNHPPQWANWGGVLNLNPEPGWQWHYEDLFGGGHWRFYYVKKGVRSIGGKQTLGYWNYSARERKYVDRG